MHCKLYLTCIFQSKEQSSKHTKITYLLIVHIIPNLRCCVKIEQTHLHAHSYLCFGVKSLVLCYVQQTIKCYH